jgi:hypothetical protein
MMDSIELLESGPRCGAYHALLSKRKSWLCLVLALLVLSSSGCSFKHSDSESLKNFANAYIDFRKVQSETEILMWVVALDQSGADSVEPTYYRKSFTDAFNTKASNRSRAEAARAAVAYYNDKSKSALTEFSDDSNKLNEKSLRLVEAANAIEDGEHKKAAVQVANSGRELQQKTEALYAEYAGIYELQNKLMDAIAKNGGDLARTFTMMKDELPNKNKRDADVAAERDREQSLTREIEERYAAFKGMTGVTLDYQPEPDSSAKH